MGTTMTDDSIRSRLQKLLERSRDTTAGGEEEATRAGQMLQDLLALYNVELSSLQAQDKGKPVSHDASRIKTNGLSTYTAWQSQLFDAIAENNFCLRLVLRSDDKAGARTYSLVGRRVNITTTVQTYGYLVQAIDRLFSEWSRANPDIKPTRKVGNSWREGCADRLVQRLWQQRVNSEKASKAAAADAPVGSGCDLVLAQVYSSEDDLNQDLANGVEPGTTARERALDAAKWAAWRAERAAMPPPPPIPEMPGKPETEAQKRRREERDAAARRKQQRFWAAQDKRLAAKRDLTAYYAGNDAGRGIGLDRQITEDHLKRIA